MCRPTNERKDENTKRMCVDEAVGPVLKRDTTPFSREKKLFMSRSAKQTVQNTVPSDLEEEETKCSCASVPLNGACAGTHGHDSGSEP